MNVQKYIILVAALLTSACGTGKKTQQSCRPRYLATSGASEKQILIVDSGVTEFSTPESVAIHNNMVYVANLGGQPRKSKRAGFFTRFAFDGTQVEKLFVGKLDDPKGFAFLNDDVMVVSDHPSVKLLNVATGKVITTFNIADASFLNDVAVINKETIVLSDTGSGTLYRITLSPNLDSIVQVIPITGLNATLNGINGITYDAESNKLFLVDSTFGGQPAKGNIYDFQFTTDDFSVGTLSAPWLSEPLGGGKLDGIAYVKGYVIVSDWDTGFYIFDANTKQLVSKGTGVNSAADFSVYKDKIWFPEFLNNKVYFVRLPRELRSK
ncbi:hypothetical protein SAMN02745150_01011 [Brevinema andersonii]|uniref:SMP-30/Gluconolaconase/LRE-like region-containing protein n=1 Tax=Brevinema andersonii TaxID=34097 RepID=A0A1I1E984_BREAD|nr:hypothetical protein [Brevinema andersonii]SFB83627.1 hypothetical protein SAMN02745150_01011 [Brevinema andersonii]